MSRLWYEREASCWDEALPIGNGSLGAMVFGGVEKEHLQLNEETVWYGGPRNRRNPEARSNLERVRELIYEERIAEAEEVLRYNFSGIPQSERPYQSLGDLWIQMCRGTEAAQGCERKSEPGKAEGCVREREPETAGGCEREKEPETAEGCVREREPETAEGGERRPESETAEGGERRPESDTAESYVRELDLENAAAAVSYRAGGAVYRRKYFVSAPAGVLAGEICAEGGKVSLDILLTRERFYETVEGIGDDTLLLKGRLGGDGLDFRIVCKVCTRDR